MGRDNGKLIKTIKQSLCQLFSLTLLPSRNIEDAENLLG